MSCYNPIKAYRAAAGGVVFYESQRNETIGDIEIPCGMCIGCRIRRSEDWTIRCMHEASLWPTNCFVTLTYKRDALPPNSSLDKADYQKFMKRLRTRSAPFPVRFFMCGEYGPLNGRPHYHAILFNKNFLNRTEAGKSKSGQPFYTDPELTEIWGHGRASVQDLTQETAGYCTGYILKKALGENAHTAYDIVNERGEVIKRTPEYAQMSLKPGIGEQWFQKYHRDITRHDVAVAAGREHQVPKYYDKLAKRHGLVDSDELQWKRELKARQRDPQEQTAERRKVREAVHIAKLRNHERSNDL